MPSDATGACRFDSSGGNEAVFAEVVHGPDDNRDLADVVATLLGHWDTRSGLGSASDALRQPAENLSPMLSRSVAIEPTKVTSYRFLT